MDKKRIDKLVVGVCKKYGWTVPEKWCYPGDLIFDITFESFLICGDEAKDIAELRRRGISYKKVSLNDLKKFLIKRK